MYLTPILHFMTLNFFHVISDDLEFNHIMCDWLKLLWYWIVNDQEELSLCVK